MLLVSARPIISPRQSERLVANLWQLAIGSRLGLNILHLGHDDDAAALAVHSPNPALEPGVTALPASAAAPPGRRVARHAYGVAATYAGTGVRVRRPLAQRRWLSRAMRAQVSVGLAPMRRHGIIRAEELSALWHPPIGSDN